MDHLLALLGTRVDIDVAPGPDAICRHHSIARVGPVEDRAAIFTRRIAQVVLEAPRRTVRGRDAGAAEREKDAGVAGLRDDAAPPCKRGEQGGRVDAGTPSISGGGRGGSAGDRGGGGAQQESKGGLFHRACACIACQLSACQST